MTSKTPFTQEQVKSTSEWKGVRGIHSKKMHVINIGRGILQADPDFYATKLISKSDGVGDREVCASLIIELVAPALHVPMWQDGEGLDACAIMRHVKGVQWGQSSHMRAPTSEHLYEIGCMNAIDRLIGNADRHDGNFMVTSRHIKLIDHGNSLSAPLQDNCYDWYRVGDDSSTYKQEDEYRNGLRETIERIADHAARIADLLSEHSQKPISTDDVNRWIERQRIDN